MGSENVYKRQIRVNGKDAEDDHLSADTTIQEKNITYPTDDKLYKKIIDECRSIAADEGIELRRSYTQAIKKLSTIQRFKKNKNGYAKSRKAGKKIKTIAGVLVRELHRKLPAERLNVHSQDLALFSKVLAQQKTDSNKTYSFHEPHVKCYTKGKEHKKFEFGSKVSILVTQTTGVIVGALNFSGTEHDSKTLTTAIDQYERLTNRKAKSVFADRGYRGTSQINETKIYVPKPDKNITRQKRKRHSRRAAIEPVIGHLKQHYRMGRNYLKGIIGDEINVLLAAAAMNFKRRINLWRSEANFCWKLIYQMIINVYWTFFAQKPKYTF